MYKMILAICHQMLPTKTPANECSETMACSVSPSKESYQFWVPLLSTKIQRSDLAHWVKNWPPSLKKTLKNYVTSFGERCKSPILSLSCQRSERLDIGLPLLICLTKCLFSAELVPQ
jgi:hypothetical protein